MRIGPLVFGAGLALLCAGVVSTRADAWDTRVAARTIPLNLTGVEVLDLRDSGIRQLTITNEGNAQADYPGGVGIQQRSDGASTQTQAQTPTCDVSGKVLRCVADTRVIGENPTMRIPPGRYLLLGSEIDIVAKADPGSFSLQAFGRVGWKGDSDSLEIRLTPQESTGKKLEWEAGPSFEFKGGRVGALNILAETGGITLEDLSRVGSIEVHATPDVRLSVKHLADIARIKVMTSDNARVGNDLPAVETVKRNGSSSP